MSDPTPRMPAEEDLIKRGPVDRRLEALRQAVERGLSKVTVSTVLSNLTVLLLGMFIAFFMVRAFNRVDTAAATAKKIQSQQDQLKALQKTQTGVSAVNQALLAAINQQTSPTATARQQAQVAGYLSSLVDAQKTLNADQLRKLGQLAVALGASPAAVNRILAEPVPVITFGPPAAPAPSPVASQSPRIATATPSLSPRASPSPAVNLQVQCLVLCPK